MASSFGLDKFKATKLGSKIAPIIEDKENIRDMIAFSRHDLPAVQVLGKFFLKLGLKTDFADKTVRQHIGRWVKEIMAREGWKPNKSVRVPPGNLFATGMTYCK